jgi:hypothetical protein
MSNFLPAMSKNSHCEFFDIPRMRQSLHALDQPQEPTLDQSCKMVMIFITILHVKEFAKGVKEFAKKLTVAPPSSYAKTTTEYCQFYKSWSDD